MRRCRLPCALTGALVVVLTIAASGRPAHAQRPQFDVRARYRVPVADAPARGPADALITIVEFSDFACRYCRRARATLALLARLYPDDIRLVFRIHPLDPEEGTLAPEASLAAREQGRFWAMHDRIFAAGGLVTRAQLEGFAVELGLDAGRFQEALDSQKHRPYIAQQVAVNGQFGVYSTPVFFINGRPIKGSKPLGVFVSVIEEELATARALVTSGVPVERVYETLMADARERADGSRESGENPPVKLDERRAYRAAHQPPAHALGPDDALVEVVVFTDFQCPFCRKLVPVLRSLRTDYPDDVRIVFRHLPLDFHADAELAAEAAVAAAAQGQFWPMHDQIFTHFQSMKRADLEAHARTLGLDMTRFVRDLDTGRYRDVVRNDLAVASALGVDGTPTLLINGVPLSGIRDYQTLVAVYLSPRLEEARAMVEAGVARRDVVPTLMARAEQFRPAQVRDVHFACSTRDAQGAAREYRTLRDRERQRRTRSYCRAFGIDL